MLLFLDFDGVLHPRAPGKHLFCNLPRLESVLRNFEFVEIVISSTWREDKPFEQLQAIFSADIQPRVVGMTPVVEIEFPAGPEGTRQEEILQFLAQDGFGRSWLALDDEPLLFRSGCPNLIACHPLTGFTGDTEAMLWQRLRNYAETAGRRP